MTPTGRQQEIIRLIEYGLKVIQLRGYSPYSSCMMVDESGLVCTFTSHSKGGRKALVALIPQYRLNGQKLYLLVQLSSRARNNQYGTIDPGCRLGAGIEVFGDHRRGTGASRDRCTGTRAGARARARAENQIFRPEEADLGRDHRRRDPGKSAGLLLSHRSGYSVTCLELRRCQKTMTRSGKIRPMLCTKCKIFATGDLTEWGLCACNRERIVEVVIGLDPNGGWKRLRAMN